MIFDLQKASVLKRISAFLLDVIVFSVLAVGFAFLISKTVGFDTRREQFQNHYNQYELKYNVDFDSDIESLSQEEAERYKNAYNELINDKEAMRAYSLIYSLVLVMISLGLLLAFLISEFAVPLFFKNGQTIGKKIFGIGVMHVNGVRLTTFALFARTVLGKYTIETMVPVLLIVMILLGYLGVVGIAVIGMLLLLEIVFFIVTANHSVIHDMLANTVVVDMSSQMIFDTEQQRIDYIKKKHEEETHDSVY